MAFLGFSVWPMHGLSSGADDMLKQLAKDLTQNADLSPELPNQVETSSTRGKSEAAKL